MTELTPEQEATVERFGVFDPEREDEADRLMSVLAMERKCPNE